MEKNPKKTKMHLTKKKRKKSKNVGLDSLEFGGSEIKIWETGYGGGVVPVEEYLVPGPGIMRELPAAVLLHVYLGRHTQ